MKIVDKRIEREKEKKSFLDRIKKADKERRERLEASIVPEISINLDWRMLQEYEHAVNTGIIFAHQVEEARRSFLEKALNDRKNIRELVVEDYEPNTRYPKYVTIEATNEYIQILQDEASKAGLEYNQYIRAIFYSTALEINKAKAKSAAELKARQEEAKTFPINGEIDQELRRKLESKYGEPKHDNVLFYTCTYGYTDMLIDLAREYFDIKK